MTFSFSRFFVASLTAFILISSASAQTTPASRAESLTIVLPITIDSTATRADAIKALQTIAAYIKTQPGLIDEQLMESKNHEAKPSHMHVMHWKNLAAWEQVFSKPEFNSLLAKNSKYFTIDGAKLYLPVQ